ncbi:hypothetical protein H257_08856 [Aphanomyces astaci]|uniref:Uncharacterized protein n=1 Tax=Aphanomyces astaci TaxID=112090 RepID=W4GED9_APHAT|nr:hypothetical protein H257_08856 [Aphanomyces astaci]ETV77439.1 hypothetical protein H257_08856 [Aphanomyces astaci]|eukprot:XP_009833226.1 hypothetical protein H257_08856 [Aphanomyces astaci]
MQVEEHRQAFGGYQSTNTTTMQISKDKPKQGVTATHCKPRTLNAPPSDEWTTYRGAIWSIMKTFSVPSGSYGSVLSVLQDVAECAVAGVASIESYLIADCMEWGWGLRESTHMVNQLRLSLNRMHVGTSAVYIAYLLRFRRDANGKVDPNGELASTKSFLNMKYMNQAKFMPWDASLNKDVDDCFQRHRVMTQQLDKDDPRKFCSSTPNRLDSAYLRIMDPTLGPHQGCPTSERIIQDVTKCFSNHLLAVINASGLALRWVHDDALEQTNLLVEKTFAGIQSSKSMGEAEAVQ